MKRILVPFDFSETSRMAMEFSLQLCRKNAENAVTLFNVIEQPSQGSFKTMGVSDYDPMEVVYIKKLIERVQEQFEGIVRDAQYSDVELNYKIVLGNPFKEIDDEITTAKMDLIVMGTSGSEGLDEFFVGSNAEKVVRRSSCPVITLKEPANVDDIDEIVFATDFEEVDDHFMDKLLRVQETFGAMLRIVRINTPANFVDSSIDNKRMRTFIEKFKIEDCSFDVFNYSNEEDGIIAYTKEIDAHMIALGTHQSKGVGHFLKGGSIAEDVVNHSPVPVWTFHI